MTFGAACVITQLNYLNKALDTFNAAIVSPIYYVMFTTLTIAASAIMFKDWSGQDASSIASEICGFITVLSGTIMLHSTRKQEQHKASEKSLSWKSSLGDDDNDEEKWFSPKNHMEWYFFSLMEKKYANGSRTNRATKFGYWNSSGKVRRVLSEGKAVGTKRTLVYYKGRAPNASRTNWFMHEYLLTDSLSGSTPSLKDSYSLCRVFEKPIPNGVSEFLSVASSEPTNQEQEATPARRALSTDCDLRAPLLATDEANSSVNFHLFGSSSLVQDIQMGNNCFNFPQLAMDDFTYIGAAETTMPKTTYHQDAVEITRSDKFRKYMNGEVMSEDINDLLED